MAQTKGVREGDEKATEIIIHDQDLQRLTCASLFVVVVVVVVVYFNVHLYVYTTERVHKIYIYI